MNVLYWTFFTFWFLTLSKYYIESESRKIYLKCLSSKYENIDMNDKFKKLVLEHKLLKRLPDNAVDYLYDLFYNEYQNG